MAIIKVQLLKSGMTLAAGIQNHAGRKLLPEGTRLTERHILNFKAWGITEANVEGDFDDPKPTLELDNIDPNKLAKVEREAESLFCHSNKNHPAVAELMRLFCLNRLQKMPGMGDTNVK